MLQLKLCPVLKKPTQGFPSLVTALHFLLDSCKPCLHLAERQVLPWRGIICSLPLGPVPLMGLKVWGSENGCSCWARGWDKLLGWEGKRQKNAQTAGLSQARAKVGIIEDKAQGCCCCLWSHSGWHQHPAKPVGSGVEPTSVWVGGALLLTACMNHWLLCQNITSVPHIPSPSSPALTLHCNLLQMCVQWEQWAQHRAGSSFLGGRGVCGTETRGAEGEVPHSQQHQHGTGAEKPNVCTHFSPPWLRFTTALKITNVMLKIKCAQKEKLKLYKAIFTLVLGCVLSPLCINCQEAPIWGCNLYSNIFKVHASVTAKGGPKIQDQLLLPLNWKRDSFQKKVSITRQTHQNPSKSVCLISWSSRMKVGQYSNGDSSAVRGQSSNKISLYAYQKYTDIPTQAIHPLLFYQASLSSEIFPKKGLHLYFQVIFLEGKRRNPHLSHQFSLQNENRRENLWHEIPYQTQIQYQISDHLVSKWWDIWCSLLFKHYQSRSCSQEAHEALYTPLSPHFQTDKPDQLSLSSQRRPQHKYLWLYKHLIQTHSQSRRLGTLLVWRSALTPSPCHLIWTCPTALPGTPAMLVGGSKQDSEAIYVISVPLANWFHLSHAQH